MKGKFAVWDMLGRELEHRSPSLFATLISLLSKLADELPPRPHQKSKSSR